LNRNPAQVGRSHQQALEKIANALPDRQRIAHHLKRLKRDTESGKTVTGSAAQVAAEAPVARRPVRRVLVAGMAAMALAVLAVAAFYLRGPLPPPKIVGSTQLTSDGIAKGSLATDGSRLYFVEFSGDHFIVSQVSIAGGENVAIPTSLANPIVLDVAPDSSQLLLRSLIAQLDSPFWLQPLPRVRRDGWKCRDMMPPGYPTASWCSPKDQMCFSPNMTAAMHKLFSFWRPGGRLSPDGSRIRFTVTALHRRQCLRWEAQADGTNHILLLPDWNTPPQECCGNWTSDGEYFMPKALVMGFLAFGLWPTASVLAQGNPHPCN
jgi:hypothetical protein